MSDTLALLTCRGCRPEGHKHVLQSLLVLHPRPACRPAVLQRAMVFDKMPITFMYVARGERALFPAGTLLLVKLICIRLAEFC